MNERLRNNPPPALGAITEGTGSHPGAEGKERGATPPARAGEPAGRSQQPAEGPKPTRPQSEAAATNDPWTRFVNERYGGDEEKAKAAVYETDSRAAHLARENAELKAGRTAPADPESPSSPSAPEEFTQEAFTEALAPAQDEFSRSDQECQRLVEKYREVAPIAEAFGRPTLDGTYVGGTVEKLAQELALLERTLERGKVGGREFDVVEKEELQQEIRQARDAVRDERDKAARAWQHAQTLERQWDKRIEQFQRGYYKDWNDRAQAEVRRRISAEAAEETKATWANTFTSLREGLSDAVADELETDLLYRAAALTQDGHNIPDLAGWMKRETDKLLPRYAGAAGAADRARAAQRAQGSTRPTPGGQAVVAPEPALQGTARERRRAADMRTAHMIRSASGSGR